jgi:uncharacterized protein with PIN domain
MAHLGPAGVQSCAASRDGHIAMMLRVFTEGDRMAKCPHCKQPVTLEHTKRETGDLPEEVHKEVVGVIKKEIMYSCPHCDAVLGFGFFIGGALTGRP